MRCLIKRRKGFSKSKTFIKEIPQVAAKFTEDKDFQKNSPGFSWLNILETTLETRNPESKQSRGSLNSHTSSFTIFSGI